MKLEMPEQEKKSLEYRNAARGLDRLCTMEKIGPIIRVWFAWLVALGVTLGLGLFTMSALVAGLGFTPPTAILVAFFLHCLFIVTCHFYFHGLRIGQHVNRTWWNNVLLIPLIIFGLVIFALAYMRMGIFTQDMGLGAILTPILTTLLALLEVAMAVSVALWTVSAAVSAEAAIFVDRESGRFKSAMERTQDPEDQWDQARDAAEEAQLKVIDDEEIPFARKKELAAMWEEWIRKLDSFHPYRPKGRR